VIEPVGYLELIGLVEQSSLVLTDSGGLQVETTVLGVPCLTLRPTTEWVETLDQGTNRLVLPEQELMVEAARIAIAEPPGSRPRPEGWDGTAGARVLEALAD
jgi:UDP-N-acetylglucosamine 2-epimerase (non-hydrolysing)